MHLQCMKSHGEIHKGKSCVDANFCTSEVVIEIRTKGQSGDIFVMNLITNSILFLVYKERVQVSEK